MQINPLEVVESLVKTQLNPYFHLTAEMLSSLSNSIRQQRLPLLELETLLEVKTICRLSKTSRVQSTFFPCRLKMIWILVLHHINHLMKHADRITAMEKHIKSIIAPARLHVCSQLLMLSV